MSAIRVERITERRRSMRVDEGGRVHVTERSSCSSSVPGLDDEFLAPLFGRLLNLSETGLLLELDQPMQIGRIVEVGVELGGSPMTLSGLVTRVCRPRHSDRAHVGIRFVGLTAEARDVIKRAVENGRFVPYLN
jgi:hypothetical protein